jgi:hypothetical protein
MALFGRPSSTPDFTPVKIQASQVEGQSQPSLPSLPDLLNPEPPVIPRDIHTLGTSKNPYDAQTAAKLVSEGHNLSGQFYTNKDGKAVQLSPINNKDLTIMFLKKNSNLDFGSPSNPFLPGVTYLNSGFLDDAIKRNGIIHVQIGSELKTFKDRFSALEATAKHLNLPLPIRETVEQAQKRADSGKFLTPYEVVCVLRLAGFPEHIIPRMASIARGESNFNPRAENYKNADGSFDTGFLQINSVHRNHPLFQRVREFDILATAQLAFDLYKERGTDPWYAPPLPGPDIDQAMGRLSSVQNSRKNFEKSLKII